MPTCMLCRLSDGFVAERHVELFERQVSGPARLLVHGGGPADAAPLSRVHRGGEGRGADQRGLGRALRRETQERTNLVPWNVTVRLFFSEAESRVGAQWPPLQALVTASAPKGGAERPGDAGVPTVTFIWVSEGGGGVHGWS